MLRRLALAVVLFAAACPKPPPVPEPAPENRPRGAAPEETVPAPVERPIPPGRQGDVPEVPPPVKP